MIKRKSLLLYPIFLFGFLTWLQAQNYMNVFNLRYYYQPMLQIKDSTSNASLHEYRVELALPFTFESSDIVGLKPQFKSINLESEVAGNRPLQIYSLKMPVFAFIQWGESKWSSYLDVSPKLNTDFKNISLRHFQVGAMVLNYYERKKDFFWQFGFVYNQDTYGPFFMPLFGIDWKINEKDYFAALLPAYVIYERRLNAKYYFGFELELFGETYRVGDSDFENSFISQLGDNKMTFLTEPRLFLDYYVSPHWVLYVKPGLRLFQKYEHYTEDDFPIENSEFIEGILKNQIYIEFGVAMRFRYDEETN
jgi:hypothetical protein